MDSVSLEDSAARVVAYNAGPDGREPLVSFFGDEAGPLYDEFQGGGALVTMGEASYEQRLLLGAYAHLLVGLQGGDVVQDEGLKQTRLSLRLSDSFAPLAFRALGRLDREAALGGRTPVEAVVSPSDAVRDWATDVVYVARTGGEHEIRHSFEGLDPRVYEHPTDQRALDALQRTAGLDMVIRKFNEYGLDRLLRVEHTGSRLRALASNFPREHRALAAVCETLHLRPIPDLYFTPGFISAQTNGVERPLIALAGGCVSVLTYDELLFVLGHEVGHIKSEHVLYHQLAQALTKFGGLFDKVTLGLGAVVTVGLRTALLAWQRRAEFTADRAGVLACQNPKAAVSVLMKVAGLPPAYYGVASTDDFLAQAEEFDGLDEDGLSRAAKYISVMDDTHPWTVVRARELMTWVNSGEYGRVVDAFGPRKVDGLNGTAAFCGECGHRYESVAAFCVECGSSRVAA